MVPFAPKPFDQAGYDRALAIFAAKEAARVEEQITEAMVTGKVTLGRAIPPPAFAFVDEPNYKEQRPVRFGMWSSTGTIRPKGTPPQQEDHRIAPVTHQRKMRNAGEV